MQAQPMQMQAQMHLCRSSRLLIEAEKPQSQ
jgi:hypothetical protein